MSLKQELYDLLVSLNLEGIVAEILVTVLSVLIWIVIGSVLVMLVRKAIFKVFKLDKRSPRAITVGKLLSSILRYIIWFIIGIVILGELNVDVTPFIASAGVIGLAIGFGAQEIVKDFISGFFIIFENSFDVGDVIEISGFKGNVKTLGLRTTTIQNWKGEIKTVNNGDIRGVINFSKNNNIAVVEFGVSYKTDLNKLQELMVEFEEKSMEKYESIIERPKFLGVNELADSSINLTLIAKTNKDAHYQVQRDLRKDIVIYFNEHGIEIPFPQLVIHNENN